MTVKELIEELQKLPPKYQNANVTAWAEQGTEDIYQIEIRYDDEIVLEFSYDCNN